MALNPDRGTRRRPHNKPHMTTREGVSGAPTLKDAPTGCSHAVCGVVEASEPAAAGKKAGAVRLTVNVGEAEPLTVVSPSAVDVGARIVVAMVGSSIGDVEVSQPTICDASMLGWDGKGSTGPVTLPKAFSPGDSAPDERPKAGRSAAEIDKLGNVVDGAGVEALFVSKPKLSKEEKEMAKLEKAAAKGDEKAAKKLAHLRLRQEIGARRAAGEEVFTDDELEKAGLEPL